MRYLDNPKVRDFLWGTIAVAGVFLLTLAITCPARAEGAKAKGRVAEAEQPAFLEPVAATKTAPWSGCYVAAAIGYAMQATTVEGVSFDANDLTYSAGGGCDVQITGSKLLIGVLGDYTLTNAHSLLAELRRSWFVGARGGVLLSDHLLMYALVGYTQHDGKALTELPFQVDYKGLTLGGGFEAIFAKHWSTRIEYRYTDLGSDLGGAFEHAEHAIRLGVAYRF